LTIAVDEAEYGDRRAGRHEEKGIQPQRQMIGGVGISVSVFGIALDKTRLPIQLGACMTGWRHSEWSNESPQARTVKLLGSNCFVLTTLIQSPISVTGSKRSKWKMRFTRLAIKRDAEKVIWY